MQINVSWTSTQMLPLGLSYLLIIFLSPYDTGSPHTIKYAANYSGNAPFGLKNEKQVKHNKHSK